MVAVKIRDVNLDASFPLEGLEGIGGDEIRPYLEIEGLIVTRLTGMILLGIRCESSSRKVSIRIVSEHVFENPLHPPALCPCTATSPPFRAASVRIPS
jgi:hypothetical protein